MAQIVQIFLDASTNYLLIIKTAFHVWFVFCCYNHITIYSTKGKLLKRTKNSTSEKGENMQSY